MRLLKTMLTRVVVISALLTGVMTAAPVGPAWAAAPTCSGTGCDNKDPAATNCDDSVVSPNPQENWGSGQSWILRKSRACPAFWARFVEDDYLAHCCPTARYLGIERQLYSPYGYYTISFYYKNIGASGNGTWWSPMAYAQARDRYRIRFGYKWGSSSTIDWDYYGAWYYN